MAVTVFIPLKDKKNPYTAYIHGKIVGKYHEPDIGTLFRVEGTACIYYYFSNYRRAYIFCEQSINNQNIPVLEGNIPLVKQKVQILYFAERRKVDLLKFLLYRTQKKHGEDIFTYSISFWLKVVSLLDIYNSKKRNSLATKRNIEQLIKIYQRKRSSC